MQADMEEARTKENTKLKADLEEMRTLFQETKALLNEEREAAMKVVEQVPVIQEVPVVDHELINKLTTENEQLKV